MLKDEEFWDEIKEFNQYFMRIIFQKLGWDSIKGEKPTYALLRNSVIRSLGKLEDKEIIDEARCRFSSFLKTGILNPDLRSAIYSIVAWTGDSKTHQQLVNLYRRAQTQEEKVRFLGALANFKDEKLLRKTLAFTLSKEVRSQNLFVPVSKMIANPHGKDLVWPWIKKNWKVLVKRFGVGNPLLNKIIGSVSVMTEMRNEKEVRLYFSKHHVPGTEMKLAQSMERIRINSKFLHNARSEFGQ
ncbi:Leucyl aminopeptidase [uncultured archaeon]|nr:Leucyl aminopeptidase [uncultured archaeon]